MIMMLLMKAALTFCCIREKLGISAISSNYNIILQARTQVHLSVVSVTRLPTLFTSCCSYRLFSVGHLEKFWLGLVCDRMNSFINFIITCVSFIISLMNFIITFINFIINFIISFTSA